MESVKSSSRTRYIFWQIKFYGNSAKCLHLHVVWGGPHGPMAKWNHCQSPRWHTMFALWTYNKKIWGMTMIWGDGVPRERADEPRPRSPGLFRLCSFETIGSRTPSEVQSVADKRSITGPVYMMTSLNTVWLPCWRAKTGHLTLERERCYHQEPERTWAWPLCHAGGKFPAG